MHDLTITILQPNLHWENPQKNLEMFESKILAIEEKCEVVVLPEMFSTGFSMRPAELAEEMDGPSVQWMKRIAAKKRIILTGSLIIKDGNKYFNRLIWMLPNGSFGTYDKRHLFGFAGEDKEYSAGSKRLIASVKGWKINLQVCYDLRFPAWARQSAPTSFAIAAETQKLENEPEYDALIYVANWPEKRSHAWKTLLQARAIENQAYVIGANRVGADGNGINHSGDSMVVDPLGEIVATSNGKEDIITETLSSHKLNEVREKLPFLKDADSFFIEI